MIHRAFVSGGLVLALIGALLLAGCGKSDAPSADGGKAGSPASPSTIHSQPSTSPAPVLRLHWLGKKRLASESNATNFLALWNLPESVKLEAQTLDKLATAPWRLWATNVSLANAPSAQLRPLLADLVQEEFYLEAHGDTNQLAGFVLAVRLSSDRAAHWQTNLPLVLQSLFTPGAATNSALPDFRLQTSDFRLDLARSGDWTLLAASPGNTNPLLAELQARIAASKVPYQPAGSNQWLAADFDLARLLPVLAPQSKQPANLPRVSLAVTGDASGLRTVGDLFFASPLHARLQPWSIPTNIIHDPLVSFTAVRGAAAALRSWVGWPEEKLGAAPDQVFFWAQSPALWQHFVTYPVANGSNHVQVIGDYVLTELNPIFLTNKVGKFDWATNGLHRLVWRGLPFFQPMLESVRFNGTDFAVFGLFANSATNRPVPAGLFAEFQNQPNLVYYDWELTAPQVLSWTQMGQLSRMVFGRAQLSPNTASLPWLRAITPSLGNVTTVATLTASNQISFKRSSTCGVTGPELHLLADWLESPQFPVGLHTLLLARGPARPAPASTNAPAH